MKKCNRCRCEKPLSDFPFSKRDGYQSWCRACKAEDMRIRRAAEPEKYRARDRVRPNRPNKPETLKAWREKNAERLRAYQKEWRASHPESGAVRGVEYRRERAVERAASARAWYWANTDRARGNRRVYVRAHPEKMTEHRHSRRARINAADGRFTAAQWREVKAQYDHRCLCCGRQEPDIKLTPDHVVPLSEGGRNDIGNIQPLCGSCNSRKSTKTVDYRPS